MYFNLFIIFILLSLSACGFEFSGTKIEMSGLTSATSRIIGSVPSLVGSISSQKRNSFYAYAATCTAYVDLYKLDANDKIIEPALARTEVNSDGTFILTSPSSTFDGTNLSHILQVTSDGICDFTLQRPLTKDSEQIISVYSTIISFGATANLNKKLNDISKTEMEELLKATQTITTTTAAYNEISVARATQFNNIFSDSATKLQNAAPILKDKSFPALVSAEGVAQNLKISAYHWNPAYQIAYQWKVNGITVSTQPNFSYTPGANSSGSKTLELYVGSDNGSGNIDIAKPYHYIPYSFIVSNSILPNPPALDVVSPIFATTTATIQILTGSGNLNCASFSHMAITVNDPTPPVAFTLDCLTPNAQNEVVTLPSGDGNKIVRLWAIDNAGVVSALPSTLTLSLQQTPPALSLTVANKVQGNNNYAVTLSATDANGVSSFNIYSSTDNGTTYALLDPLAVTATSYTWAVPNINSTTVKLKIEATDSLGNASVLESAAFTVDSTAPGAPALTRTSAALTGGDSADVTVSSCTDRAKVIFKLATAAPSGTDTDWAVCNTSTTYAVTLTAEGSNSIYGFAMDDVGNISLVSTAVTVTRDKTTPSLTLNSPNGVAYVKGGAIRAITWTASDTNMATSPISIDYSDDGGTTWSSIATGLTNSGSYNSWTAPSVDITTARLRITAVDLVGNSTIVTSSQNFVIDSTEPTLSNFTLNNGSPTSATSFLTAKVTGSDNRGLSLMRLSLNSTYSDTNWQSFTSSNFTYQVPYTSSVRTVYVWLKDLAGNVSASPISASITISLGAPPLAAIVSPDGSAEFTTSPQDISVQWQITTPIGLSTTSLIELTYASVDLTASGTISTSLTNGINNGCVIASGNTGCTTWAFPASLIGKLFKLKMKVTDLNGSSSIVEGPLINGSGLKLFAGKNSESLTQSSLSVALYLNSGSNMMSLALDSTGNLYFNAVNRILKFDGSTGNADPWMGDGTYGNTGNGADPSPSSRVGAGSLATDHLGNVYFSQYYNSQFETSIRKYNATTGKIEQYIGISGGLPPAEGILRTQLGLGYTQNTLAVDSLGRLYFPIMELQDTTGGCNRYALTIWRVGTDDSLELVAGDQTRTSVVLGADARGAGLGEIAEGACTPQVTRNWGGSMAIRPADSGSATDVLYYLSPTGGFKLYSIPLDTHVISKIFDWNTNMQQIAWDPTRGRIVGAHPSGVFLINPGALNSHVNLPSADANYVQGITVDKSGGIYYSTNKFQRIFYIDPTTNIHSTFAGVLPFSGSGGPATSGELRAPQHVQTAPDGSVFFADTANAMIRKIQTDRNLLNLSANSNTPCGFNTSVMMLEVLNDSSPLSMDYYYSGCLSNPVTNTVWGINGILSNPAHFNMRDVPNGTDIGLIINMRPSLGAGFPAYPYVKPHAIAQDPVTDNLFILVVDTGGTSDAQYIKMITPAKLVYHKLGTLNSGVTHSGVGTPLASAEIRSPSGHVPFRKLQAYNGILYLQKDTNNGLVFRYPAAGNVERENATTGASLTVDSYLVDGPNAKFYWMRGNSLYSKPLGSEGTTLIATFPWPLVVQSKGPGANTLLLTHGNYIYEYTNSTHIP